MKPQELEGSKTICNFMWFYLSCSSRQPGHRINMLLPVLSSTTSGMACRQLIPLCLRMMNFFNNIILIVNHKNKC